MTRNQAYIVVEIITDEDCDYPGGHLDWRTRDLCDLHPGDIIASRPGTMDECHKVIGVLQYQAAHSAEDYERRRYASR